MFRWSYRYLNSMPFQTGFDVHTVLQDNLTLQLHAVSERMEEHELNFARISPRISEMPRLVFRVWKHWMMKSRH